ncbi:hypothetical protein [Janthinobacterium sp.]|uniref:hypothetical protein n=1 Tax=Janthinobacterium sp. TaxID=1871054 RepID=UPI00293D9D2B|nr:hypothetical protein [Janthinobacterium sp.]
MQSDYLHHPTATNPNADHFPRDDDAFLLSSAPTNPDVERVDAREHHDRKHAEIRDDEDKSSNSSSHIDGTTHDDLSLPVPMSNESCTHSFYDEFPYTDQQHNHSHDSLLQLDHGTLIHLNTATSSTDDLSATNQLSSSAFHSKDSALGLSDDNLNYLSTNQLLLMHDDDDDDDRQQPQRLSPSLLTVPSTRQSKYLAGRERLNYWNQTFATLSMSIVDRAAHNDDAIRSNIDCVHLDYSA